MSVAREAPAVPRLRRPLIPTTPPPKRHPYNQWAPDARALDLVGDKWTLLVIRDLLWVDKHLYNQFLQSGENIPTNILADRLKRLEQAYCEMGAKLIVPDLG